MLLTSPYAPLVTYLRRLRSNPVALNSAYMMGSQFSVALLQVVQFLLAAEPPAVRGRLEMMIHLLAATSSSAVRAGVEELQ
jgi:hypothetical protein